MSPKHTQVHTMMSRVAISLAGSTQTLYVTPMEAEMIADALNRHAHAIVRNRGKVGDPSYSWAETMVIPHSS